MEIVLRPIFKADYKRRQADQIQSISEKNLEPIVSLPPAPKKRSVFMARLQQSWFFA
jgi:hypothetical protein